MVARDTVRHVSGPPTPTVPLDEAQTPVEQGGGAGPSLTPGTRIGRYLIVDKIGEGGAGAVYAAFDAKLDRKVALKLLQPGAASMLSTLDPGWPKLVQEARMLAKLSDPEVVTVFDVGEHEGVGYLAMEYVEGGDLAGWIAKHRGPEASEPRSVREVLALMLQAGEGLAAAHRAGVVHGDFKPANVLIDGRERAKVSDFGIARLRGGDASPQQHDTLPGIDATGADSQTFQDATGVRWVGTPAFMAPEQFDGVMPSEQTDVYAFFTALFQAVYGALPWRANTMMELATLKAHRPPSRRSGVSVPRWLDQLLDQGLAVEPGQRLPSMEAALARIRRGMRGRRRAGFAVAVGVVSVAGLSTPLWLSGSEGSSLCRTDGFGWDAQAQAQVRAAFEGHQHHAPEEAWTRVDARLQDLDAQWAEAWAQACASVDTPALQQRSLDCLERQRRQGRQLVVAWTSATEDGKAMVDRATRAATGLEDPSACLELDHLSHGVRTPTDPELAAAVAQAREQIDEAAALERVGRMRDALPAAQRAVETAEATAFEPVIAEALLLLGRAQEKTGDIEGAAATLERAYFQAADAEMPVVMGEAAARLMWVVGARLEKHDEGLLWAQHADTAHDKTGASKHRLTVDLGALLERKGDYAGAQAKMEEGLAATPPDALFDLGIAHLRLGDMLRQQQDGEGAVANYAETIALWTEALGESHPNVAKARAAWASGLSRSGRNEEAVEAYRAALASLKRAHGAEHPSLSASLINLGITLKNLRRFDEAEDAMRQALTVSSKVYGPEHRKTADRREALGRLLTKRGQGAEALSEHQAAGKIYAEVLEPGHPWITLNLMNQGDALRQMQVQERAEDAYRRGYEHAQGSEQASEASKADAAVFYGRALVESGKYARARAVLAPARAALQAVEGYEDIIAIAGWALARAQAETGGDVIEALALARASRDDLAGWPEEQAALDAWVEAHAP